MSESMIPEVRVERSVFDKVPEAPITFTRESLRDAGRISDKLDTMSKALVRETAAKATTWLRDEIAKAWKDEHMGENVPADEVLAEWALQEGFQMVHVIPPNPEPGILHYVITRRGKQFAGLQLRIHSFNVTPEEAEKINAA